MATQRNALKAGSIAPAVADIIAIIETTPGITDTELFKAHKVEHIMAARKTMLRPDLMKEYGPDIAKAATRLLADSQPPAPPARPETFELPEDEFPIDTQEKETPAVPKINANPTSEENPASKPRKPLQGGTGSQEAQKPRKPKQAPTAAPEAVVKTTKPTSPDKPSKPEKPAKPVKTSAPVRTAGFVSGVSEINASQALILQALAKAGKPVTTEQLKKIGAVPNIGNLGPVRKEPGEDYADSLVGRGLVKPVFEEGEDNAWEITPAGVKMASTVKTRKRTNGDKVDPVKLDAVVVKMRGQRTYGLELWTDADLKECREALGSGHEKLPLDSLRLQITNRRKQGAYSDPAEKARNSAAKCLREFGSEGTVIKGLLNKPQIAQLQAIIDGTVSA